jgi:integrase
MSPHWQNPLKASGQWDEAVKGHIQQRGARTWRLKFDVGRDPSTGKRITRFVTFHGTKREAQSELARLIAAVKSGDFIEASRLTIADYLRAWVKVAETASISPKTAERYRELIERQIIPFIGATRLQKLKAAHVAEWHAALLREGRHDGSGLAPRTVGHAHRVLHKALADAVARELLLRNPASLIAPPKIVSDEIEILSSEQVATVLDALGGERIYAHVVLLLSTGIRRGELMGLQWGDVDFDRGKLRIERAIEVTRARGIRAKAPKTRHGRRLIALPPIAVELLREQRKAQLELRLKLGIGKLLPTHYIFGDIAGEARHPGWLTDQWQHVVNAKQLPQVSLHALRHSHASALIASGQDVVTVSRRLGHSSPTVTLAVYAHLFDKTDQAAANAIEAILKPAKNKS